jgi:hypothetical protein
MYDPGLNKVRRVDGGEPAGSRFRGCQTMLFSETTPSIA